MVLAGNHKNSVRGKQMIWCLFLSLIIFTCFNYKVSGSDIFNPAVVVSGIFSIFSFFCCLANFYIGIDIETVSIFLVIGTGIGIFSIIEYFLGYKKVSELYECKKVNNLIIKKINIGKIWLIVGVAILLLTIYVNYKYILAFGAAYGAGGDFFSAMVQYKVIMSFHDADDILLPSPWYRNYLSIFSYVFAYLSAYLFMRAKVFENQFNGCSFLIMVLFGLYTLMGGGRSNLFQFLTAIIFLWYVFSKNNIAKKIDNKKIIFRLLLIFSFISLAFILFLFVVGRTQKDLNIDYIISSIFVYAGAPIFNLDIYLQNPWKPTHGFWGELTFIRIINWIGMKFSISSFVYELDLPFLSYQNYNLGNVYTTFYAFYYDFQYLGVVFLTLLMALLSTWIYNKVLKENFIESRISTITIVYSYLVNDLIMLAFSNRFYETITDMGFIYKVILLWFIVYYINHFSLEFNKDGLRLMKKM